MNKALIALAIGTLVVANVNAKNAHKPRPDRGRHLGHHERSERSNIRHHDRRDHRDYRNHRDYRSHRNYRNHRDYRRVIVERPIYRRRRPVIVRRPVVVRPRVVTRTVIVERPVIRTVYVERPRYESTEDYYPTTNQRDYYYEDEYETCSDNRAKSQDKVRRRNAILVAGAVNEMFNNDSHRRRNVRKGAIAATVLNEILTR